jgi:hypothetical protein
MTEAELVQIENYFEEEPDHVLAPARKLIAEIRRLRAELQGCDTMGEFLLMRARRGDGL